MTLMEMRACYPSLFHPNQDWFVGEQFTVTPMTEWPRRLPTARLTGLVTGPLVPASALAALYIESPADPIWRDYLWTADVDQFGQRVYVGGTANGKGFEIHRHLHLTPRFGTPVWD